MSGSWQNMVRGSIVQEWNGDEYLKSQFFIIFVLNIWGFGQNPKHHLETGMKFMERMKFNGNMKKMGRNLEGTEKKLRWTCVWIGKQVGMIWMGAGS